MISLVGEIRDFENFTRVGQLNNHLLPKNVKLAFLRVISISVVSNLATRQMSGSLKPPRIVPFFVLLCRWTPSRSGAETLKDMPD